jgi:exopolysaccharide biosynthesis protein
LTAAQREDIISYLPFAIKDLLVIRRISKSLALLLLVTLPASGIHADVVRRTVAPGIEYTQETIAPPAGPLVYNVLKVNLKAPGVHVQTAIGKDVVIADDPTQGRETVAPLAIRHGAIAAINADFFPYTGDPLGIAIRDGELVSESMPHRAAMAITSSGQALFDTLLTVGAINAADGSTGVLDGINRLPEDGEITILTPTYGTKMRTPALTTTIVLSAVNLPVHLGQDQSGKSGIASPGDPRGLIPTDGAVLVGKGAGADWLRAHVKEGEDVKFHFDFMSNPLTDKPNRALFASRAGGYRVNRTKGLWLDATQAVGGGPWLVRNGQAYVDGVQEGMSEAGFTQAKHPRSAIGVTATGELLIVAVDGRQAMSRGVSLPELAQYMLKIGAVQAINLDGGGSTSMVIDGLYVNSPSDGEPRAVADALLVYSDAVSPFQDSTMDAITFRAGEKTSIAWPVQAGANDPGMGPVWGTMEGKAYVDQAGNITSTHAGRSTIVAVSNGKRYMIPLVVTASTPSKIRAALTAAANNPPDRNQLTAVVTDAYGNPVAGQIVKFQITGGAAEQPQVATDERGRATVEVVWDVEKGRKATVSSGALGPVEAK